LGLVWAECSSLHHRFAVQNDLFEYAMAGFPLLASDLPEIRRVVAEHDVGLVVNPADRAALGAGLERMVDDADARQRWASRTPTVFETFSWERASQRLTHAYQNVLS